MIRAKCNRNGAFSFKEVSFKEIEKEIRLLKLNKASQYSDIPTKIIKENSLTTLNKKCNKSLKENYRPVSILPILSKVFERSMFK